MRAVAASRVSPSSDVWSERSAANMGRRVLVELWDLGGPVAGSTVDKGIDITLQMCIFVLVCG